MSRLAAAILAACAAVPAGCGDRHAETLARRPAAAGQPVARVGREVITDVEVAAYASQAGVGPRDALARLIDEELLAQAAIEQPDGPALLDDLAWRGRIQALLRVEVERPHTPERLDRAEVARAMTVRRPELNHDGLTEVVHFVVAVAERSPEATWSAATATAARIRSEVVAAHGDHPPPQAFLAVAGRAGPGVRAERLAPVDRNGWAVGGTSYVAPFSEHAFALTPERPLSEPFRTSFGMHVALLVRRLPPATMTASEAEAIVRRDLAIMRRNEALRTLVERLRVRRSAHVSESALAAVRRVQRQPSR